MKKLFSRITSLGKILAAVCSLTGVVIFLCASFRLSIVALFYFLLVYAYYRAEWSSTPFWKDETTDKTLRGIFKTGHFLIRTALICTPLFCIVIGLTFRFLPEYADKSIADGLVIVKNERNMTKYLTQGILTSTNSTINYSAFGVVQGKNIELLPTEAVIKSFVKNGIIVWCQLAFIVAFLSVISAILLLFGEKLAEVRRKISNAPTNH